MRKKWLHILVLAWQAVWLLAIVPGHTRGQIVLPGTNLPPVEKAAPKGDGGPRLQAASGCCSVSSTPAGNSGDEPAPVSEQRKRSCAVCHFAARMSVATALVFVVRPPELLEELPVPQPVVVQVESTVRVQQARAPPRRAG